MENMKKEPSQIIEKIKRMLIDHKSKRTGLSVKEINSMIKPSIYESAIIEYLDAEYRSKKDKKK